MTGEWIAFASGIFSLFVGVPVMWKTVIQPAARRIADAQITGPILSELARINPPVPQQIEWLRTELRTVNDRLTRIEAKVGNGR